MTDPTAEWEIPLCEIRPSSHQGNERLYESLQRLRRVEVTLELLRARERQPGA